ncbi:hypothetical protein JDS99_22540 [Bacillus cereus group sp. N6]|nr:hypothetical protein [Bacillus cereus group sp. N6]
MSEGRYVEKTSGVKHHELEVREKRHVNISIANYEISNPAGREESRLTLSLLFNSNDYSLDKFTRFLKVLTICIEEFNAKN